MIRRDFFYCIAFFLFFINSINTQAQENSKLSLKFKGSGTDGVIALIIVNQDYISYEINEIMRNFTANDFRVALVPKNYNYDLTNLDTKNSPFVEDVKYIVKMTVHNKSLNDQVINMSVEILNLQDKKIISEDIAAPRHNIPLLMQPIRKKLSEFVPKKILEDPIIIDAQNNEFVFFKDQFPSLRRGDEITIRYTNSRNNITESLGIVQRFSNDTVIARDVGKQVQTGDTIVRGTPQRNRFSLNLGLMVPTLGERVLTAQKDNNIWESNPYWPVGFQIAGEYERFLPYQLISTTAFGISVDRSVGTYLMTGIGYRVLLLSWEFVPYLRLGVLYSPIGLQTVQGGVGELQGFALRIAVNLGFNIMYRINKSIFIGADIGVQYYPYSFVSVLSDSKKTIPQWKRNGIYSDQYSGSQLYPYLNIKIGWLF